MKQRAYAKINLCLDVVRRREDGYHELEMIMAPINLYDSLDFQFSDEMKLKSNVRYLPIDQRNTIIKAIEIMREEFGFTENFEITLQKHIPSQAGMAGGSADGAAAIRALNRMLNLNMDQEKMIEIAKKVGADVPFCLRSRPAYVQGIGEKLQHFYVNTPFYILLVKPHMGVSTKTAFETLDFSCAEHPDCHRMQRALRNNDYQGVIDSLGNTLEQSAFRLVPQIAEIKKELIELGFDGALMSGSGSTVFGITRDQKVLDHGAEVMRKKAAFVRKTELRSDQDRRYPQNRLR